MRTRGEQDFGRRHKTPLYYVEAMQSQATAEVWRDPERSIPAAAKLLPAPLPGDVEPHHAADRDPRTHAEREYRRVHNAPRDMLILLAILLPQLAWMGLLGYLALSVL